MLAMAMSIVRGATSLIPVLHDLVDVRASCVSYDLNACDSCMCAAAGVIVVMYTTNVS
jgi:hypothetical protein